MRTVKAYIQKVCQGTDKYPAEAKEAVCMGLYGHQSLVKAGARSVIAKKTLRIKTPHLIG